MLPYAWLSLAIVSLWLPPQIARVRATSASPLPLRHAVSAAWLILAVGHGYATGIVMVLGVLVIVALGLLCYRYSRDRAALTTIAVLVFSLALMAHVVPGFANLLVVRDAVLSPDAVPYTLYLNFDKAQIGLFLLAFARIRDESLRIPRPHWGTMVTSSLAYFFVWNVASTYAAVLIPSGQAAILGSRCRCGPR